ncbi:hypothetical protein V8F06_014880 [Rhypophila decipiens]
MALPNPNLLLCQCIDGVLAMNIDECLVYFDAIEEIVNAHTESCILFLKVTDATAREIERLSASKHMKSVLWGLARPTLSHKFSLIQLLAISTIDGVATFQIRAIYDLDPSSGKERYHGDVNLAPVLDKLRFNLDMMCEKARETGEIATLLPEGHFGIICQSQEGLELEKLALDENGRWRAVGTFGREDPLEDLDIIGDNPRLGSSREDMVGCISSVANSKQMIWLSNHYC